MEILLIILLSIAVVGLLVDKYKPEWIQKILKK